MSISARIDGENDARNFSPGQPAIIVDTSIWAMFFISTIFVTLRFYCRWSRSGHLLPDDYVLVAGWIFMLTSASLLTKLMSLGFMDVTFGNDMVILYLRLSQCKNVLSFSANSLIQFNTLSTDARY